MTSRWFFLIVWLVFSGCTHCSPSSQAEEQSPNVPRETWDVYLLQGKRVGHGHTAVSRRREAGREVVQTENASHLSIQRAGQASRQDVRTMSVETPDGRLLRFESEVSMGPTPVRVAGQVRGDRLDMTIRGAGGAAPSHTSIPWSTDCGGPFAVEQGLVRQPMQPGDRRTLKMLMAGFNQIGDVEMNARAVEKVETPDGARQLLRIETVTRLPLGEKNQRMKVEQTLWTDESGEVFKSFSPAVGGLEIFRASKAEALKKTAPAGELDLLSSMMVKCRTPFPRPRKTKQVRFRVHLEGGDPANAFVVGPTQAVQSIDPHTAEITVYAIRPGQSDGNPAAPDDPPTDDDRRPNNFIQSDDPLVVELARRAAGTKKDPWQISLALESFVNRTVREKDFSQVFATAAEVAKNREGDCTEHAVLMAGLARALGIPARVAIGLVYLSGERAFFYHMWTELYIDGRWIPLDATSADGGVAADHLKIATSNLKGTTAYGAFLPVAQVAGRLSIQVVEAK